MGEKTTILRYLLQGNEVVKTHIPAIKGNKRYFVDSSCKLTSRRWYCIGDVSERVHDGTRVLLDKGNYLSEKLADDAAFSLFDRALLTKETLYRKLLDETAERREKMKIVDRTKELEEKL